MTLKHCAFNVGGPVDPEITRAENLVNEICKSDKIREFGLVVTLYDASIFVSAPANVIFFRCNYRGLVCKLYANDKNRLKSKIFYK